MVSSLSVMAGNDETETEGRLWSAVNDLLRELLLASYYRKFGGLKALESLHADGICRMEDMSSV